MDATWLAPSKPAACQRACTRLAPASMLCHAVPCMLCLLQGGVQRAEIQLGHLSYCGAGILFSPGEGSSRTISNVQVSHFSAAQVRSIPPFHWCLALLLVCGHVAGVV